MILALLTTMNSKGKVHVVDGSKCVLDCSPDKQEPDHPRVFRGPVWDQIKTEYGAGGGVQGAGRDAQIFRREGSEPPGGWQWCEKCTSIPRSALSHPQASICLCSDVMARLRSEQQRGELESRLDVAWRRVAEGGGEWRRLPPREGLVGLSCLHLQQSEHGRVVSKFHPPLGGQAHVLGQVVHSSCTETKRKENHTSDRW